MKGKRGNMKRKRQGGGIYVYKNKDIGRREI